MTSIFTRAEKEQFLDQGWVLARAVAPEHRIRAAIDAICAFHGIFLEEPSTWYRIPPESWDIIPLHQHQALWDNRSLPAVHPAFSELLGTHRLWVSMDRAGFKAPIAGHPELDRVTPFHLDGQPEESAKASPPIVQGMLYLTDCTAEQGAFECIPSLLGHTREKEPEVAGHAVVPVPARAGDLVIWNALLPHRGGKNRGPAPRCTQYITMAPEKSRGTAEERVALWREKRVPRHWRSWPATVKDPEPGEPALLDDLGRRLLGLDPWP